MHPSVAPRFMAQGLQKRAALSAPRAAALRIAVGVCALTAASKLQLPFWGTPVPFTLGPQMALLLAALLGHREGVAVVLAWMGAGLMGAPVFASGLTGWAALLGPTGGYVLGYLPAAYLVGRLSRKSVWVGVGAWLMASAVILAVGAAGIGLWSGPRLMWPAGVAPFVMTDFCKALLGFSFFYGTQRASRGRC